MDRKKPIAELTCHTFSVMVHNGEKACASTILLCSRSDPCSPQEVDEPEQDFPRCEWIAAPEPNGFDNCAASGSGSNVRVRL